MSPSKKNRADALPTRSSRSTWPNTTISDNIVHEHVSERKIKAKKSTQIEVLDHIGDSGEDKAHATASPTVESREPGAIKPLEIVETGGGNDEIIENELSSLGKCIREIELAEQETVRGPILKICQTCNRQGHIAENCRSSVNSSGKSRGSSIKPYFNLTHETVPIGPSRKIICQLCKRKGHRADKCFSILCENCGRQGHFSDTCIHESRMDDKTTSQDSQMTQRSQYNHTLKQIVKIECHVCQGQGYMNIIYPGYEPYSVNKYGENYGLPRTGVTSLVCQEDNGRGHTADKSFHLFPVLKSDIVDSTTTCQLCKMQGHGAKTCPILGNSEAARPRSQQDNVPHKLKFQQIMDIKCQICKRVGHGGNICSYRYKQAHCPSSKPVQYAEAGSDGPKLVGTCHYCHQLGHFIRECPAKQASDTRYKNSSANGVPTTGTSGATENSIRTISIAASSLPEL